jgi:HEAT repeat protein
MTNNNYVNANILRELIATLYNNDPTSTGQVLLQLEQIGTITIPYIIEALESPDANVRKLLVFTLGQIGSLNSFQNLIQALQDKDTSVQGEALLALGKLRTTDAFLYLKKALKAPNPLLRQKAAEGMEYLRNQIVVKPLLEALKKEKNKSVRLQILHSLFLYKNTQSSSLLKDIISNNQEDEEVKSLSIRSLGFLGDKKAVEPLLKILQDQNQTDEVRRSSVVALDKLLENNDQRFLDALLSTLKETKPILLQEAIPKLAERQDKRAIYPLRGLLKPSPILGVVAKALGKLGDKEALEPILGLLNEEIDFAAKLGLVEALGHLGNQRAIEPLLRILENRGAYWELHEQVIDSLNMISGKKAVEVLIQTLNDDTREYKVRVGVADALGETKTLDVIPPLIKVLSDENDLLTIIALGSIKKIAGSKILNILLESLENKDFEIKMGAISALGILRDKQALSILKKIILLEKGENFPENVKIRTAAIAALTKIEGS